jgi:uncharacterized protein
MPNPAEIVSALFLSPHPEGGYFRETYRSEGLIAPDSVPEGFTGARNFSTCIYYLLTPDSFSAFHQVRQDEIWHFYEGTSLTLHLIHAAGDYSAIILGRDLTQGEVPQFVVPGGTWFAAEVNDKDGFVLAGCTVAPGFDFDDFRLGSRAELSGLFPGQAALIRRLTREDTTAAVR